MLILFFAVIVVLLFFIGHKFNLKVPSNIRPQKTNYEFARDKIKTVTLKNGINVIIYSDNTLPKVFLQVLYNVGSSSESSSEKGLAHLVEHMIFKGTEKLSESDINVIARKYGAKSNAATSYDFTKYYFETNSLNWKHFIPIMADCMQNAKFDPEHLASELKAVVQELNGDKDNFQREMLFKAIELTFPPNHPYHFRIIGFKEVLANLNAEDLKNFYKRNYQPKTATIFVVGDINIDEALNLIKENFEEIKSEEDYPFEKPSIPPLLQNLEEISTTIYQDVKREEICFFWQIPSSKESNSYDFDLLEAIVFSGKNSLLYKRLIEKDACAESISSCFIQLKEGGIVCVFLVPKKGLTSRCEESIISELSLLCKNGISAEEINREAPKLAREFIELTQDYASLTTALTNHYLAKENVSSFFEYINNLYSVPAERLNNIIQKYFSLGITKKIYLKPFNENTRKIWEKNNLLIKKEEAAILENHKRTTDLEPAKFVHSLPEAEYLTLKFPQPTTELEMNGLKILLHKNNRYPITHFCLKFKEMDYLKYSLEFDALDIMMELLEEGSVGISKKDNQAFFASMGANVNFSSNGISCSVLESNFLPVLDRIFFMIKNPTFKRDAFERLKLIKLGKLEQLQNSASYLARKSFLKQAFKDTDFDISHEDRLDYLKNIGMKDIISMHHQLNPFACIVGVSGFFNKEHLLNLLDNITKNWNQNVSFQARTLPSPNYEKVENEIIPLLREQLLLSLNQVNKFSLTSKEYPYLRLLSFILFGPMGSRMFNIRERTGLFYSCNGSFAGEANPWFSFNNLFMIINPDKLDFAKKTIFEEFSKAQQNGFSENELNAAKIIIQNNLIELLGSSCTVIESMIDLKIRELPLDFFEIFWNSVKNATLAEIDEIFSSFINIENWNETLVGQLTIKK